MKESVKTLVYTSVDDMRGSLQCQRQHGGYTENTLTQARDLAESLGMRSKVRLLEAELRWIGSRKARKAGRKS